MKSEISKNTFSRFIRNRQLLIITTPLLLIFTLVIMWETIRYWGIFERSLIPSSEAIFLAFLRLLTKGNFWKDIGATLFRSMSGLTLALLAGLPLGLLIGSNKFMKPIGIPLIDFLRSIPVTTLYPVFVLTLGIGDRGKIGMIFLGCVLIFLLHAAAGFEQRSKIRHQISKLYGASPAYLLFKVSFFEAIPTIMTGLRVAVGLSLIISTLTEMFMGATRGIGQSIMEAYSVYNLATMYAYIFSVGIIGFIINRLCVICENYTNKWKAS